MKRIVPLICMICLSCAFLSPLAGNAQEVFTFKFVAGDDMFYVPWDDNDAELNRLYLAIETYRSDIVSGHMPIYVDGYSSSMKSGKRNLDLAFIRANRVKSELITRKGLIEGHFITKNHGVAYTAPDGTAYKDIVVVTLRLSEKATTQQQPQPKEPEQTQEQLDPPPHPRPLPHPKPVAEGIIKVDKPDKLNSLALRTNLLYNVFLLPTLGVEWHLSHVFSVKLDGSYAFGGSKTGNVQKMWMISPELRYYLGNAKRLYLGAGANIGEANIYGGMMGGMLNSLFSDDTGYQGSFINAGLTAGYRQPLSGAFALDFNLGLGYSSFEYDTFNMVDKVRVYRNKDVTKKLWGPTQAGVSLMWIIGGNR